MSKGFQRQRFAHLHIPYQEEPEGQVWILLSAIENINFVAKSLGNILVAYCVYVIIDSIIDQSTTLYRVEFKVYIHSDTF